MSPLTSNRCIPLRVRKICPLICIPRQVQPGVAAGGRQIHHNKTRGHAGEHRGGETRGQARRHDQHYVV